MKIAVVINGCSASLKKEIEELNSFISRFTNRNDEIEAWILMQEDIDKDAIKLIDRINYVKFIRANSVYLAEEYLELLEKTYESSNTDLLLFGSGLFGCELSVRLAYRLSGSSCIGVRNYSLEKENLVVEKLIYSNNLTAKLMMKKAPYCISIAKGFKDKIETLEELPKYIVLDYNTKAFYPWIKSYDVELTPKEDGLTSADIVVAVGRGVGNKENLQKIEEFTQVIGGELGASRPVVMSAWTGMKKLIGASGSIVSPKICIAIGVSGAAAFHIGIEKSKWIVVINNDESAPILKGADVAIVGDYKEVVEEVINLIID